MSISAALRLALLAVPFGLFALPLGDGDSSFRHYNSLNWRTGNSCPSGGQAILPVRAGETRFPDKQDCLSSHRLYYADTAAAASARPRGGTAERHPATASCGMTNSKVWRSDRKRIT